MKKTEARFFYMTVVIVLFCAVLSVCSSSPVTVSTSSVPASTQSVSVPDDLNTVVRETSDYLNRQLPRGNKLLVLNVQSEFPAMSEYIIDELIANTVNDRIFSVVDRQQLDAIRAELGFQMSGEVDDATAQTLGRIAGAQIIISGAVSKIGDLYRLRIRALSVQSAQIEGQFNRNIPSNSTLTALAQSRATGYGSSIAQSGVTSISGTAATPTSPAVSPKPGTVYNGNGHSYEVINQAMSWNEANTYARDKGGYLAIINDANEQAFIHYLIMSDGNKYFYWLGGYRNGNTWNWLDGSSFGYTNWYPRQPDNYRNNQDKLIIMRISNPAFREAAGKWDDCSADGHYADEAYFAFNNKGFICEYE